MVASRRQNARKGQEMAGYDGLYRLFSYNYHQLFIYEVLDQTYRLAGDYYRAGPNRYGRFIWMGFRVTGGWHYMDTPIKAHMINDWEKME